MPLNFDLGTTGAALPIFLFVLYMIGGGMITAWLAQQRGRDGFGWFILGAIFGVLAVAKIGLAPALPPSVPQPDPEELEPDAQPWNPYSGAPPRE